MDIAKLIGTDDLIDVSEKLAHKVLGEGNPVVVFWNIESGTRRDRIEETLIKITNFVDQVQSEQNELGYTPNKYANTLITSAVKNVINDETELLEGDCFIMTGCGYIKSESLITEKYDSTEVYPYFSVAVHTLNKNIDGVKLSDFKTVFSLDVPLMTEGLYCNYNTLASSVDLIQHIGTRLRYKTSD